MFQLNSGRRSERFLSSQTLMKLKQGVERRTGFEIEGREAELLLASSEVPPPPENATR